MLYTKNERLKIGKEVYEKELTPYEASIIYDISIHTAKNYYRLYKAYEKSNEYED